MKKSNYFITVQNDILESELISSRAKLLYGYIVSLSQRKGYCFATNKHFAEKFGVCRKTVTRDLKELSKANCIETKVIVEENGNRLRYIFPLSCPVGRAHSSEGQVRASPAPQDKDAQYYIIKGNKKNISSYESKFKPNIN